MTEKINITYWWQRVDGKRNGRIKKNHQQALKECALDRIFKMIEKGYVEGELYDCVGMDDSDGKDGVEYSGWWKLDKE